MTAVSKRRSTSPLHIVCPLSHLMTTCVGFASRQTSQNTVVRVGVNAILRDGQKICTKKYMSCFQLFGMCCERKVLSEASPQYGDTNYQLLVQLLTYCGIAILLHKALRSSDSCALQRNWNLRRAAIWCPFAFEVQNTRTFSPRTGQYIYILIPSDYRPHTHKSSVLLNKAIDYSQGCDLHSIRRRTWIELILSALIFII